MYTAEQGQKMDRLITLRESFVSATRRVLQDYQSETIEFDDDDMDLAIDTAEKCANDMWEACA